MSAFFGMKWTRTTTAWFGTLTGLAITEFAGPIFITKQKPSVEFINTEGTTLDCLAHGDPDPEIEWYKSLPDGRQDQINDIPSIRKIYNNGSMVLKRFSSDRYLQDIHATTYRCSASNYHGRIISIPVSVRAITKRRKQQVQSQVYDEYVIKGNTAVLRCHIPTFFKDDLKVTSWVREDNHIIYRQQKHNDRYTVTETGNLHIRNVLSTQDQQLGYWCQVKNRFTNETFLSQTAGRIKLMEPHSTVLPTITDIIETVFVEKGKPAQLSCAAQGNPPPTYRWIPPDGTAVDGDGILTVTDTEFAGSYEYRCTVTNGNGEDSKSTFLMVTETLGAFISQKKIKGGNEIELKCHTSGYPIQTIFWTLNGKPFGNVSSPNNKDRVVIKNVQRKDRGMYQCFVSNQWDAVQATLQLKPGDFAPSFTNTFKSRTLQPGPSIELECTGIGRPNPMVEWIRNGNKIYNGDNVMIRETVGKRGSVTSQLTVKSIKVEDGGKYVCKIGNKLGVDTHSERINIYGLPIVHKINDVSVGQGLQVTLNCYVSGFPIKSIAWSRADSKSYMPSTSKTLRNGTLIISKVAKRDQGRYMCTASNGGGQSDSQSVHMNVLLKPEIDLSAPRRNLPEGGSITLTCTIIQGDDPINFSWKRNGKLMTFNKGTDITSTKLYSLIQIRKLNYSHRGTYTCSAENPAGRTEKSVEVTVSVAPKWEKKPKDINSGVGEDVRITCTGSGNPIPSTEWFKFDNTGISPIDENNSKYKFEDNKTTVVIRGIDKSLDQSKYRCVITNGVMPDLVKEITVKVISVSMRIQNLTTHSSAYYGANWTVVCNIEDAKSNVASERIQMIWLKDSKILTKNFSERIKLQQGRNKLQLVVDPVKFEDEGMYTCQVSVDNKLTESSTTTLKVLPQRIVRILSISTPSGLHETAVIASKPTESQVVVFKEKDYDNDHKERHADAIVDLGHGMEQKNQENMKKDINSDSKNNRGKSIGAVNRRNMRQIIVFVIPAAVVIILLIAVVSTIIAYVVLRRSAKRNQHNFQSYRYAGNDKSRNNDYAREKEDAPYIPSSTNGTVDRRYGRLKSSSLKYGDCATQNTYEIPDYCGGVKPYSTLQISRNSSKHVFDDNKGDSQCSV
ncbi:Uncharacterised protein r2_g1302 [Pycnogonum litorale]